MSTPIGNLEDITIRAIKTLFMADVILCEDTRRTGLLLQELHKRYDNFMYSSSEESLTNRDVHLLSYYDEIEAKRIPEVLTLLEQEKNIALVSDAGTPLISDPGFLLIREAIKRNIPIISVPGPSALLTALTMSGLPTQPFLFLGYPPEKQSHRTKLFANLFNLNQVVSNTYIFYCAPHKLIQTLEDMKEVCGDIDIVVARELTKIYEEVWRGKISDATVRFQNPKGEFVILFTLS